MDVVESGLLFPVLFAFISSIVISLCSIVLKVPWVASSMSLIVFGISGFASFGRRYWRTERNLDLFKRWIRLSLRCLDND